MGQFGGNSVAARYMTLALMLALAALSTAKRPGKCVGWGYIPLSTPTPPQHLLKGAYIMYIAAGAQHAVAITSDHRVISWGETAFGLTKTPSIDPKDPAIAIASGRWHSLALLKSGKIVCWGDDSFKQCSSMPKDLKGVVQIAAGSSHNCALCKSGKVTCWGSNMYGESTVPAAASSDVISIACGRDVSVVVKRDGSVHEWGFPNIPALMRGSKPAAIRARVQDCIKASVGNNFAMCVRKDGSLAAWSYNPYKQLKVPKSLSTGVVSVSANLMGPNALVLLKDGRAVSVALGGKNFPYDEIIASMSEVPKEVQSNVYAIACGSGFQLACVEYA